MIKAFKGFTRDLKCRGFQFKEGETFEIPDEPKLCEHGFHACEDPVDCFAYYSPGESEYHEVELEDVSPERRDDSKVVAKRIKVGAKISIKDMIAACISLRFSKTTHEPGSATDKGRGSVHATGDSGAASATGDSGAASATGDSGAASATGYRGAASATGYRGAASATGDRGAASATGDSGAASATGDRGAASATGDSGAASATGYRGAASATGDSGAALSIGNYGSASVSGKDSIAISLGYKSIAKGEIGDWIVLAEREEVWSEERGWYEYPIKNVKAFLVDGKKIKADTFYKLVNGKAVQDDKE